ncbi:DUF2637 domain-containing protein [Streptomyces smyrnaeus]|uniref:DUF2637 domain-containing protein n=1 Tax=Streptomyces smyrnaeus TaxID=1387713 RepID=A0ABS3XQZ7_9ACTN|nr:DUF2637 domain-containing protein [Streptomyces smyrnaeus]MBO8197723.1 DUF2637 domain-containing protein [Streptomyces smyrnaeus]
MTLAAIPGTAAIRAGIGLLGAIGFALSYDALRQMAAAVHIRGPLTYAFPLVIDGFIAIGIGALLILRAAALPARLYVWALVGLATATSIWANALHAVRLNQPTPHGPGLHLDNATVGVLSAIPPLALAGAVHLYLLVHRHNRHTGADEAAATFDRHTGTTGHQPARSAPDSPTPAAQAADTAAADGPTDPVTPRPTAKARSQGRPATASMEEILAIGRMAPRGRGGWVSRRNVEAAIRAAGHSIGRDRLTEATRALQDEADRHEPEHAYADA